MATKVSISVADRPGIVAAVAGRLFDLGANLGDTSFAVLGTGCEFTTVCDLPDEVSADMVVSQLTGLEELAGAEVEVPPFTLDPQAGPTGQVSHRIVVDGGDRPGLIARLCEVFVQKAYPSEPGLTTCWVCGRNNFLSGLKVRDEGARTC